MSTRKDKKGRKLRVGEYWDSKAERYVFRKMIEGKRYTITDDDLVELRKKESKLLLDIEKGTLLNSQLENISLDEYFELWCKNAGKMSRKATSFMNCKSYYCAHIKGTPLGIMKISKIRKIHCQTLFNSMIEQGKKKSTLNNMKACLTMIFSDAEDDNVISKNPCKNIKFNQTDYEKREPISEEQMQIFMEFIRNDDEFKEFYPLFIVIFNLGLRVGEVAGLTWSAVDFDNCSVTIKHSLNRYRKNEYGYTVALASPKSKTSNRTIKFNDLVLDAFKQQKKRQFDLNHNVKVNAIPIVDDYGRIIGETNSLVFFQANGNALNEPQMIRLIHRIVNKQNKIAELEGNTKLIYFTPHQVRHTYTTLAYEQGVDGKELSERLGHASSITTLGTYTHLRGEKKLEQEAVANKIRIS